MRSLVGAIVMLSLLGPLAGAQDRRTRRSAEIKVFLVALDDNGKHGRRVGCGDSLIPVVHPLAAGSPPLRAAIEALLASPSHVESSPELRNFWVGEALRVRSIVVRRGIATIRLSGHVSVAGVCDEPRIEEQIRATAMQFRAVRRVMVFIDNVPLESAIR